LQAELQHQLEVRGLDQGGNTEELANRLLDNLINQVSVLQESVHALGLDPATPLAADVHVRQLASCCGCSCCCK
jgi:hypothetical protein